MKNNIRCDLLEAIIVNISKKHDTEGVDSVLIQCLTDLLLSLGYTEDEIAKVKESLNN